VTEVIDSNDLRLVVESEMQLLRPEVRANREQLETFLDDDFVEIGASGRVWTRDEIIDELVASPTLDDLVVSAVTVRLVAPGLALVSYVTSRVDVLVRRTAWWRASATGWRCFFHQGTPIPAP
jgi:hypothetical protein